MKISSKDLCVQEGDKVDLRKRPTNVDPVYKSKEQYQELLGERVAQLSYCSSFKPGCEPGHRVQHPVHVHHDVVAIDLDPVATWCPQRHVQHGPALGRVDLLPGEHGVARRVTPCWSAPRRALVPDQ